MHLSLFNPIFLDPIVSGTIYLALPRVLETSSDGPRIHSFNPLPWHGHAQDLSEPDMTTGEPGPYVGFGPPSPLSRRVYDSLSADLQRTGTTSKPTSVCCVDYFELAVEAPLPPSD